MLCIESEIHGFRAVRCSMLFKLLISKAQLRGDFALGLEQMCQQELGDKTTRKPWCRACVNPCVLRFEVFVREMRFMIYSIRLRLWYNSFYWG